MGPLGFVFYPSVFDIYRHPVLPSEDGSYRAWVVFLSFTSGDEYAASGAIHLVDLLASRGRATRPLPGL